MTPRVDRNEFGSCGCGRSPTGECCGWHALTEQEYQRRLADFLREHKEYDPEHPDFDDV